MLTKYRLGWQPALPDIRDFDPADASKARAGFRTERERRAADWVCNKTRAIAGAARERPVVDLTRWFSLVEDQGDLGSCTANAGVALLEYYEKRAFGSFIDASRIFLYKVTRKLLGVTGDTGADLRTTMKAMTLFGVLPEAHVRYDVAKFDDEPTAFDYAYAANYQCVSYFRLDQPDMAPHAVLERVKAFAAAELPSMFGFTIYNFGKDRGEFVFPSPTDRALGGHAVVVAGYDDGRQIGDYKGALRIRNSWGGDWGEGGYGWLPYEYVLRGLAADFWSLFRAEYIGNGPFE
ncbi:MAG TPA: C1 family peptidase [Kofleriaceae bacterium]|nr:C1 family peptidase [Kofleriaceae bacterium]